MSFINQHSDLDTVNYLSKSVDSDTLYKALDRSGLVQVQVLVHGKNGDFYRNQWVSAEEAEAMKNQSKPAAKEEKKPVKPKREQVPATDFNVTPKIAHLKPINGIDEVPAHLKGKIPPNWRKVMVSRDASADIQAVGKDDQNRPQYVYSDEYIKSHTSQKFDRINKLIQNRDNVLKGINTMKDRETGDCLSLIFNMGIRPGSTKDTKSLKEAYGATTLKGKHVVEEDDKVFLRFTGKKGVEQNHEVLSQELASMLKKRKEAAGDDGDLFHTTDANLRKVLKAFGVHPKDLRTMLATTTARDTLKTMPKPTTLKEFTKVRNSIGDIVCGKLGNTRTMSLTAYIDPAVFEEFSPDLFKQFKEQKNNKDKKKEDK
jgi:DNA topoisomerase IB